MLAKPQTLLNCLYSRKRGGLFLPLIESTRRFRLTIIPIIGSATLAIMPWFGFLTKWFQIRAFFAVAKGASCRLHSWAAPIDAFSSNRSNAPFVSIPLTGDEINMHRFLHLEQRWLS